MCLWFQSELESLSLQELSRSPCRMFCVHEIRSQGMPLVAKRRHQAPYPEHSSVAHCQALAAALRAGVITNADQEPLPAFLKIYIAVSLPALNHVVKVDRKRRRWYDWQEFPFHATFHLRTCQHDLVSCKMCVYGFNQNWKVCRFKNCHVRVAECSVCMRFAVKACLW